MVMHDGLKGHWRRCTRERTPRAVVVWRHHELRRCVKTSVQPHQEVKRGLVGARSTWANSTQANSTWANEAFFRLRPKNLTRFFRLGQSSPSPSRPPGWAKTRPRRVAPEVAEEGWGPKISRFFSSLATIFFLSSLSLGVCSWNFGFLKRRGPEMRTFGEKKTCTFEGPRQHTPPKFHEKTPREREE